MTTYLFIDGAYLRRNYVDSVRPWFGSDGEIDFREVKGDFGAERAFYYDALEDEQRPNESGEDCESRIANDEVFFNKIQELDGYFVRLGSLGGRRNRHQKKVTAVRAGPLDALGSSKTKEVRRWTSNE